MVHGDPFLLISRCQSCAVFVHVGGPLEPTEVAVSPPLAVTSSITICPGKITLSLGWWEGPGSPDQ